MHLCCNIESSFNKWIKNQAIDYENKINDDLNDLDIPNVLSLDDSRDFSSSIGNIHNP